MVNVPSLPAVLNEMKIQFVLPQGWTMAADGSVRCAEHEERRVIPATSLKPMQRAKMN